MTLLETCRRAVSIGEQADSLCRALPNHRLHMALRDLALNVEHSVKALSHDRLKAISTR